MKVVSKAIFGLFVIGLLNTVSCNSNSDSSATSFTNTQESKTVDSKIEIPIYGSFDDLEPLFNKQTDTTYVINFWATWCKPCIEELPYFEKLHEDFGSENLKVILVSLDFPKDFKTKLIPFVEEHQLRSDVVLLTDGDYNAWIDKVSTEWTGAIPATIVYKADQRQFKGEQFADYEELADLVRSLL